MANTVRATVGDPDNILHADMYGPGAIIRLTRSATVGGVFTDVATATVVTGTLVYLLYDPDGTSSTWYRWRYENQAGTKASRWEGPLQSPEDGLYLSVDQFRTFVTTALTDDALEVLLRAATQTVVSAIGNAGAVTERLYAVGPLLRLSRPAVEVVTLTEDGAALAATDWEISETGLILRRLDTGANPRGWWAGPVDVTYIPRDDLAERQRVVRELVRLDLSYQPGLSSQTIGTWSETYNQAVGYAEQRNAILASLGEVLIL